MLFGFLVLAVADSLNPSAIAVTLFLLSRGRVAAQVVVYVSAIFVTYLTLGVVMMSGLDTLVPSLKAAGGGRIGFIVQGAIGLALLIFAIASPETARPAPRSDPGATTYAALALLGVTVTAMELPTAVPYFGAIALLTSADLPTARWLLLLVVYNVIFVLPPLLFLAGHLVLGHRIEARYGAIRARMETGARATLIWIAGFVGGALFAWSVIEYVARFVLR